jgi:ssDNA thymidine ADP-ribosyltransferase, DarT
MPIDLNPERGLLFRITHIANLPWLLVNGLHCAKSTTTDANFTPIGNPDLIDKRTHRPVPIPPGGMLSDYVPFYFTPKSPMLYNISTGYGGIARRENKDIVILVSSWQSMCDNGVTMLFTDRHAYVATAAWSSDRADLAERIDWDILCRHDFARNDSYPDKMERYQAEALAHRHVPSSALLGVVCVSEDAKRVVEASAAAVGRAVEVFVRPTWYF